MSRHEGVSCDSCMRQNFSGDRFKCLKCFDFDLCRQCYETDRFGSSSEHSAEHPVQCVLTKDDFDFTYWGEPASSDELRNMTFTCPYCATLGYSMANLYEHIRSDHTDINYEVICPVCVATPNADPNRLTDDLVSHLAAEHINRTGRSSTDDTAAAQIMAAQSVNGASRLQRRLIGAGGNGARQATRRGRPLGLLATAAASGNVGSAIQRNQQYNDAIAELLAQTHLTRRTAQVGGTVTASELYQVVNQQISGRRQRSRQLITSIEDLDDIAMFENMLIRDPGLAELYSQALNTGAAPAQQVPVIAQPDGQQTGSSSTGAGGRVRATPFLAALQQYTQAQANSGGAPGSSGAQHSNAPAMDMSTAVQDLVTELVPDNDDIATLWQDPRFLTARYLREQACASTEEASANGAEQADLTACMLAQMLQQSAHVRDDGDDGDPPATS